MPDYTALAIARAKAGLEARTAEEVRIAAELAKQKAQAEASKGSNPEA